MDGRRGRRGTEKSEMWRMVDIAMRRDGGNSVWLGGSGRAESLAKAW